MKWIVVLEFFEGVYKAMQDVTPIIICTLVFIFAKLQILAYIFFLCGTIGMVYWIKKWK